MNQTPQKMALD